MNTVDDKKVGDCVTSITTLYPAHVDDSEVNQILYPRG